MAKLPKRLRIKIIFFLNKLLSNLFIYFIYLVSYYQYTF